VQLRRATDIGVVDESTCRKATRLRAICRPAAGRSRANNIHRPATVCGCENGPASQTHLSRLNQDVAAGDFEAAYVERFRSRLRRAWRLITSQFPHQGKDKVGIGAIVVLF
jgi:hypothetical protein